MALPLRLGVTGGIASGKSTVVAQLAGRGAAIIDTDAIAHALTGPQGAAVGPIRAAFGEQVLDPRGALDRARMRDIVFADPRQRARLEGILHPLILEACLEQARAREAAAPLLVFDVPLLVEAQALGRALHLDRVLLVDCPPALQRARARLRGTMSDEQVRAVISSQAGRSDRLDAADDILVNAGSPEALRARVDQLWDVYSGPRTM